MIFKKLKINVVRVLKKIIIITGVVCLGVNILTACSPKEKSEIKEEAQQEKEENNIGDNSKNQEEELEQEYSKEETIETSKKDEILELMDTMSINEKIGQMFIIGFEGYEPDEYIKELIVKNHVGGIILFSKNISTVEQTKILINELNQLNSENKVKLFMSVDEEGGMVSRIPKEMGAFEAAWDVGSTGDLIYAYEHGKAIGTTLKSLGFNVDFAPVLDVNSNPNNPVIGTRAFSNDPYVVRDMAVQVYKGLKEEGIIAVGKHFPGHGDTSVDSHLAVPVIDKSLKQLEEIELIPFEYAIKEEIPMIMTSHLMMPQLDGKEVASLSEIIMKDILRGKLNFNGVTISDDMVMGGITENYRVEEGTVKAIEAGQDMVILSSGYENQIAAIEAVKKAVNDGRISEEKINESVYRILTLKREYLK